MRRIGLVLLVAGCFDAPPRHTIDAAIVRPIDAGRESCDALGQAEPDALAACLSLAPARIQGTTPLGDIDAAVNYFSSIDGMGTSATIRGTTMAADQVSLEFSYPLSSDCGLRYIEPQSYEESAVFQIERANGTFQTNSTMVHVDVATWREGPGIHSIDITATVIDPRYALAPVHVEGTFCDWLTFLF